VLSLVYVIFIAWVLAAKLKLLILQVEPGKVVTSHGYLHTEEDMAETFNLTTLDFKIGFM